MLFSRFDLAKQVKPRLLLLVSLITLTVILAACSNTATSAPASAPTVTATSRPATVTPPPATTIPIKATLNTPFKIKYNEEIKIEAEGLTLKFVGVANDSRCPQDVTCVHSGQATASLRVQKEGQLATVINLTIYGSSTTAPGDVNISKIDKYSVKLVALEPSRNTKKEVIPADYVVTLLVS